MIPATRRADLRLGAREVGTTHLVELRRLATRVEADRVDLDRGDVELVAPAVLEQQVVALDPAHRPLDHALEAADPVHLVETGGDDYVSRGGHKLAGALDAFAAAGLRVDGRRCLDAGASTGGFTDVLLRRGASAVVAVDVGYGQLAWALRGDPRVRVLERTNVRSLTPEAIGGPVEVTVADVSFIPLHLVLPALHACTVPEGDVVPMVKPQFEVGRERVGRGGVVRVLRAELLTLLLPVLERAQEDGRAEVLREVAKLGPTDVIRCESPDGIEADHRIYRCIFCGKRHSGLEHRLVKMPREFLHHYDDCLWFKAQQATGQASEGTS